MAKQAQLSKSEPAQRPVVEDKPAVALVPEKPAEPKRRGRPPGSAKPNGNRGRKSKASRPTILSMVETEEGTGQFEPQSVNTVAELLDLMDENRKVTVTREWREF